jgi:hypothetical protein
LFTGKGDEGFSSENYRELTSSIPYFAQTSILCLASLAHKGWKGVLQDPEKTI